MKTLHISDEAYEALKTFIIDPFDDTPEQLIVRLMEIANKARQRWSPFEKPQPTHKTAAEDPPSGTRVPNHTPDTMEVVL